MNIEFLIYVGILVLSNLFSVYMGSKIATGQSISPLPKKLEVIVPEEEEIPDPYGNIWPVDREPIEEGNAK